MPINIAVCDDEDIQNKYICSLLIKYNNIKIHTFLSAEEFLFKYEDKKDIDIILLDIEMKEMNGIELAKAIRRNNDNITIIFITGYTDYLSQGYDVEALHYLLKPLNRDKFYEVMDKAIEKLSINEKYLIIKTDDVISRFKLNDIIYIEAVSHYCNIVTQKLILQSRISLSEIKKS